MERILAACPILLVFLPGLDGTGALFRPLLDILPAAIERRVVCFPTDRALSYDELMPVLSAQFPADRSVVLIAESFSGPLALRYAAAHADHVRAVVLCASFVRSPVPAWIKPFVRPILFRLAPPSLALRLMLLGWRTPASLLRTVRDSIRHVSPHVLAHRVREVLAVNCTDALAACAAPILYLRASRDSLVRENSIRQITSARSDVIVRTVPGPHLLLQAEPVAAWNEIAAFLSSLEGRAGPQSG